MYEAGKHCSFIPQAAREIVFDTKLRYENFSEILGSIITLRRRYKFSLFVCQSLYSSSSGQKAVHSRTDVSDLKKMIIRTTRLNDMASDRKGLRMSIYWQYQIRNCRVSYKFRKQKKWEATTGRFFLTSFFKYFFPFFWPFI